MCAVPRSINSQESSINAIKDILMGEKIKANRLYSVSSKIVLMKAGKYVKARHFHFREEEPRVMATPDAGGDKT